MFKETNFSALLFLILVVCGLVFLVMESGLSQMISWFLTTFNISTFHELVFAIAVCMISLIAIHLLINKITK